LAKASTKPAEAPAQIARTVGSGTGANSCLNVSFVENLIARFGASAKIGEAMPR